MASADSDVHDLPWPYDPSVPIDTRAFPVGHDARRAVANGMKYADEAVASAYGPFGSRVWKAEYRRSVKNGLMIIRGLSATGLAGVGIHELILFRPPGIR